MNIFLNKGRVEVTTGKKKLFLLFFMIVFVVVLLLVINQDNDIRSIIKDKKIFEEIKDEKNKDTPELNKLAQKYEDKIA